MFYFMEYMVRGSKNQIEFWQTRYKVSLKLLSMFYFVWNLLFSKSEV